ncbi:MAG: phosphate ABC transporter ATP-binding protein [Bacillota bacterium]
MSAVYELEDVRHIYDGRTVIDIERLEILEGEIFGIIGPSGAGKSTLLRLLNFLEPPRRGIIRYRGKPYSAASMPSLDVMREITTVLQKPALLSTTVFHNIAYPLRIRHKRPDPQQVASMLQRVGLGKLSHVRASSLSGGEAQRVALARALIFGPRVLLLDEPTANLDPANTAVIERLVREFRAETKMTVVVVTHNVFQAKRLCDRVMFLNEGACVEVSDARSFFESPKHAMSKAFLSGEVIF